jgi:hypothetical protein
MKWVALAAGAIALALVAIVFYPLVSESASAPAHAATDIVPVVHTESPRLEEAVGPSNSVAVALPDVFETEWKMEDTPATVARRLRDAKDKRAFYDRALAIGGGAHLFMARQASVQCIDVQFKGMVEVERGIATFIRQDDPQYARRLAAYRSVNDGCEGFETKRLSQGEWSALEARIAEQPDLMGLAFRGVKWDQASHQQVVKSLREVILSDDPYLIEIAGWRLRAHHHKWGERVQWTKASQEGWWRDEVAWEWALCELGKECGPDSRYGRLLCGSRGLCDWSAISEVASRVWTSQYGSVSPERKDEIVHAIRARDWAKLGL